VPVVSVIGAVHHILPVCNPHATHVLHIPKVSFPLCRPYGNALMIAWGSHWGRKPLCRRYVFFFHRVCPKPRKLGLIARSFLLEYDYILNIALLSLLLYFVISLFLCFAQQIIYYVIISGSITWAIPIGWFSCYDDMTRTIDPNLTCRLNYAHYAIPFTRSIRITSLAALRFYPAHLPTAHSFPYCQSRPIRKLITKNDSQASTSLH